MIFLSLLLLNFKFICINGLFDYLIHKWEMTEKEWCPLKWSKHQESSKVAMLLVCNGECKCTFVRITYGITHFNIYDINRLTTSCKNNRLCIHLFSFLELHCFVWGTRFLILGFLYVRWSTTTKVLSRECNTLKIIMNW